MYHCEKESEKNDEPILRKMLIRVRALFLPADNNSSLKTEDTTLSSNLGWISLGTHTSTALLTLEDGLTSCILLKSNIHQNFVYMG